MDNKKQGYMQQVDELLTDLLKSLTNDENCSECEEAKRQIKNQLLRSYRNGQRDCSKCNPKHEKHQPDTTNL